ncbi:patatin-like phospholipase family protein [Iocasia frigidifontis]|uniref:Patatin-like phospholipase family protein n=1 Tax=Iocasia fonsfrigidae TaxID=2682810 RepID=A0A8A7KHM6_9FIRM|nr:patatin-like phospholipase family protein [Iocasia fonsfrigidae]QTL99049.1 patatin-like phospholipase family protein [Iocasia fonsfrigidae]
MYGLVLEGGGSKGAYQIGAYRAIKELGFKIDAVSGTSIGALNGAMIAQGKEEEAYELWYNIKPSRIFNVEDRYLQELKNFDFNQHNILYFLKRAKEILNNRGLDISLIRGLLEKNIDEKVLRESAIELGIVTVNLSDMEPLELFIDDIPDGKIVDYLIASAYFPAFKLEKLDGKLLIDGGFYDNLPINMLVSRGYKEIIAVRTYGLGRTRKLDYDNTRIRYITPQEDLGRILDFSNNRAKKNLQLGYHDTLKVFKGLKGNKYYISSLGNERLLLDYLMSLKRERILEIGRLMNLREIPVNRLLFEHIIPRCSLLLGFDRKTDYEDIIYALLERAAKNLSIDRFHIYSFNELLNKVSDKLALSKKTARRIPGFIRQNDLLAKTVKDELLNDIVSIMFS